MVVHGVFVNKWKLNLDFRLRNHDRLERQTLRDKRGVIGLEFLLQAGMDAEILLE